MKKISKAKLIRSLIKVGQTLYTDNAPESDPVHAAYLFVESVSIELGMTREESEALWYAIITPTSTFPDQG